MKLYVGNLNYDTTEDSLKTLFGGIGEVKSLNMIKDKFTGRPKGFGFVEFDTDEIGNKAIADLNGKEVDGRKIIVSVARPMEKRSFSKGPRGGGRDDGFDGGYRDKKYGF